ncbi:MAG: hypothetical protein RBR82_15820 [Pseudomonas sp.]|nr:hypothetical protein [Pseudomonas sp.]
MTIVVNAATLSAVVANGVSCEKVYMNGSIVFESGNSLTVGSQDAYVYGYSGGEEGFGSLSQTTFTGYGGSIDGFFWFTDPGDAQAILRLSAAPYPSKVKVTVGDTVLIFQGESNGAYVLNISQTVYNALPKSGTVKVKFEVMA